MTTAEALRTAEVSPAAAILEFVPRAGLVSCRGDDRDERARPRRSNTSFLVNAMLHANAVRLVKDS